MHLPVGTRLGPYEIDSPLGSGGMGEVYRARDTRLDRSVAIKVLPRALASDPQFRERFNREARAISAFDHPHVCTLHDVGEHDGISYLVMQYLEGETLADRLGGGRPIALADALAIATQICDALDAAHRRGIVHRDLKPGNVMLTRSGAKLLDFGLAKTHAAVAMPGTVVETQARPLTGEGALLGTLYYMSPEQVEGREADARSDIWAFGCVLYEMLTGHRPFDGASPASVVGSILRDTPPPISRDVPVSPPALDRVVAKCLAKGPDRRWQSASDLRDELQWIAEQDPAGDAKAAGSAPRRTRAAPFAAVGLLLLGLVAGAMLARALGPTPDAPVTRFSIELPPNVTFGGSPVLSPDGAKLVFVGQSDGRSALWLRSFDTLAARQLDGTEDAQLPFWSPDSRSIAFFGGGRLKRIDAAGGRPLTVADAPNGRGGSWSRNGVILFAPAPTGGLVRVPAGGGKPEPVTKVDAATGENSHRFPEFLPDGNHFLFRIRAREDRTGHYIASLDNPAPRRLLAAHSNVTYSNRHVLFARDSVLFAQKFDPDTQQLLGEPAALAEDVGYDMTTSRGSFSASGTGALAYYRSHSAGVGMQLQWFDRAGRPLRTVGEPGVIFNPSLSPDGRRVLYDLLSVETGGRNVWMLDVDRNVASRFSFSAAVDVGALWSPDGKTVVFGSSRSDPQRLYEKSATGSGEERPVTAATHARFPTSWSADGKHILYEVISNGRGDIWSVSYGGSREEKPLLATEFDERQGHLSPDGRWLAYTSNESGRYEVYVQRFRGTGEKVRVSTAGGVQPQWRRDGKELFFLSLNQRLMAVSVSDADDSFVASLPNELFAVNVSTNLTQERNQYAADARGERFLVNTMSVPPSARTAPPIVVIQNWPAAIPR